MRTPLASICYYKEIYYNLFINISIIVDLVRYMEVGREEYENDIIKLHISFD